MSEGKIHPAPACDGLFLVRRPVFDREHRVWGYELAAGGTSSSEEDAGTCVLSEGMGVGLSGVGEEAMFLAPFTRTMLVEQRYEALPLDRSFLQIHARAGVDEQLLDAVRHARNLGYGIALDGWEPDAGLEPLVDLADLLKLSVSGRAPREVIGLASQLKERRCELVARGVADWQTYEGLRALGFALFQGPYFSRPRVEPGHKLSKATVGKARVLGELLRPGRDIKDLPPLISSDPMLSYRLLRFINSASFALVQRVNSVEQAVNLLGLSAMRQWAMFMVVADIDDSGKGEELAYLGLQRARFLEQCAEEGGVEGALAAQSMFLLGLFSVLDALLGLPMREALRDMPLDEDMHRALCGDAGPVRTWLDLVQAVEAGEWERCEGLCARLGLVPRNAAVNYLRASAWAGERFSASRSDEG